MKNLKFSLITPTNNPKFLGELYQSIHMQEYESWEWIIVANNGGDIPFRIAQDKRVKAVFVDKALNPSGSYIGAIKRDAFSHGSGDILVEVDHDDLLTSDCLLELNKAFQDTDIGFVYSDNAKLSDDFKPYNPDIGWTYEKYKHRGKELYAMKSPLPSACTFQYIWYCPDHVRAWRKSVYDRIGKHDPSMEVCDDHELMIRTYLNTKVKKIEKVLYLYRIYGQNTWLKKNKLIQQKTVELGAKHIEALAKRESEIRGLQTLRLGNKYISMDYNEGLWAYPDNSIGILYSSHLPFVHDQVGAMKEIHRVLAHGGLAFIDVPSTDGRGAFQDPRNVSFWNENSFYYYTRKEQADFIGNTDIKFMENRLDTGYPSDWYRKNNILTTNAWLVAVKDGERRMGNLKI